MIRRLFFLILFTAPVFANDVGEMKEQIIDLMDRLSTLENRIAGLEGKSHDDVPAKDTAASSDKSNVDLRNLIQKVNDLETRLGQDSGKVSDAKAGLSLGENTAREKSVSDADDILDDMMNTGAKTKEEAGAMKDASAKAPSLPSNDFQAQYDEAMGLLKKKSYKEAIKAFEYCLKISPDNKKCDRVLYHLGNAYEGHNNLEEAKKSYVKAFKKDSKGPVAADSLLKLAGVFKEQKNTKSACTTLKEISKRFPQMESGMKKKIEAAKKDAKCPV